MVVVVAVVVYIMTRKENYQDKSILKEEPNCKSGVSQGGWCVPADEQTCKDADMGYDYFINECFPTQTAPPIKEVAKKAKVDEDLKHELERYYHNPLGTTTKGITTII